MSSKRFQIARLLAGFILLIVLALPTQLLVGILASYIPTGLALAVGVIALLCAVIFGSRPIAEKLSKR